jgi:hypothetical protein
VAQPIYEAASVVRWFTSTAVSQGRRIGSQGNLPSKEEVMMITGPSFGTFPRAESNVPMDGVNPLAH